MSSTPPFNIVLLPDRYKKKAKYEYWVNHYSKILNVLYDSIYTYRMMNICGHILEECDFNLFCRFCYENSNGKIVDID